MASVDIKNPSGDLLVRLHEPYESPRKSDTLTYLNQLTYMGWDGDEQALPCAQKLSEFMKPLPALNNRSTWDANLAKSDYQGLAKLIDGEEAGILAKAKLDPSDAEWWVDSGLMASLVARYKGGNCDDLASFATATAISGFSGFVVAFTQIQSIGHSFVLIQSQRDTPWVLDTWVSDDRVVAYGESLWAQFDANSDVVVHAAQVFVAGSLDISRVWYEWFASNQKKTKAGKVRGDTKGPRFAQVGKYTHPSAKSSSSSGF